MDRSVEKTAPSKILVSCGILLLLTMVLPWGSLGEKPLWVWALFTKQAAVEFKLMIVMAWTAGLAAVLAGIFLRAQWRAVVCLLAGGTALTLYIMATGQSPAPWRVFVPLLTQYNWLQALAIFFVAVYLVATGIRPDHKSGICLRAVQNVSSLAVMFFLCMACFDGVHSAELSACAGGWATIVIFVLAGLLAVLGALQIFRNPGILRECNPNFLKTGRRLVCASLLVLTIWNTASAALLQGQLFALLGPLNNTLLLAGISLILLEGLTGVLANVAAAGQLQARWVGGALAGVTLLVGVCGAVSGLRKPPIRFALPAESAPGRTTAAVENSAPQRGDWPQWCGRPDHNMVSGETGLPESFEQVSTGKTSGLANVKWVVPLGASYVFGTPAVADGKVYLGGTVDARNAEYGMLWCFRESDGKLLWRLKSPYIPWLYNKRSYGICATPTVEGKRLYLLDHRGEVLCLTTEGLGAGNAGPFTGEADYFATGRKRTRTEIAADGARILEWSAGTPAALSPLDADIVWSCDMPHAVNCWPFNAINTGILVRGDRLYIATTSTLSGCGEEGSLARVQEWRKKYGGNEYDSPSLIVLDKHTGKLLARDRAGIFNETFHGAHSSPTLGTVNGKELLFYGGGNGSCYAFDPEFVPGPNGEPGELKPVWRFNCLDQTSYASGFRLERLATAETIATPVFYKNRIYTSIGNDLINSGTNARQGRLVCIDATQTGDITRTGRVWSFDDIRSTSCTVAIAGGLLYTGDASGKVYCLDADTGELYWSYQASAPVWGAPLAADGKVFVATHGHGLLIFAQGKTSRLLFKSARHMDLVATPVAANGAVYLASQQHLYALQQGASGGVVPLEEGH